MMLLEKARDHYAGYSSASRRHAGVGAQDIEISRRNAVDILEFFCLTPLPGSEDHKVLWQKGVWMDPDMNKYDLEHVVTGHSRMSQTEWEGVYASAWKTYYTFEHMETVLRRAAVFDLGVSHLSGLLYMFGKTVEARRASAPSGLIRSIAANRRHCMPLERPWCLPRFAKEFGCVTGGAMNATAANDPSPGAEESAAHATGSGAHAVTMGDRALSYHHNAAAATRLCAREDADSRTADESRYAG